jgi:hypothetical protein
MRVWKREGTTQDFEYTAQEESFAKNSAPGWRRAHFMDMTPQFYPIKTLDLPSSSRQKYCTAPVGSASIGQVRRWSRRHRDGTDDLSTRDGARTYAGDRQLHGTRIATTLIHWGTEEQKKRYILPFSMGKKSGVRATLNLEPVQISLRYKRGQSQKAPTS